MEEPKPEKPKKNRTTLFIVIGVVVVVSIIGIVYALSNRVEIPEPPYIDENGEVNWDKKYQLDK